MGHPGLLDNVLGSLSDRRLKRNIEAVGNLPNGLALYRFSYLWSEEVFVGVMAQEVLHRTPEAIIFDRGGYLSVDYSKLGFSMLRWDDWITLGKPGAFAPPPGEFGNAADVTCCLLHRVRAEPSSAFAAAA